MFCNIKFLMGLASKAPNSEQFAIEIYLLIHCQCCLHFCLDYSKAWWQFNCLRITILFILWIYLEFCWKLWVLIFIKALFITSLSSCSQASVCKTTMEKVSHQFWHPVAKSSIQTEFVGFWGDCFMNGNFQELFFLLP